MTSEQPAFLHQYFSEAFQLRSISGGLSNQNYHLQLLPQQAIQLQCDYFVREFGQHYQCFGNDAQREMLLQSQAAKLGLAPQVQYFCNQGMVTDWVSGRHLSTDEWKEPDNQRTLAKRLGQLHSQNVSEYELDLKQRLTHYFDIIEPAFKTIRLRKQLEYCYDIIENKLAKQRQGFCHHDLNPLNLMMSDDHDLRLLDWEFAAQGHCDFDLATLLQTMPWSEADIESFLLCYNQAMTRLNAKHVAVVAKQLQYMLVIVEMMTLLWAIIMHQSQPTAGYLPIWQDAARALSLQLDKIAKL